MRTKEETSMGTKTQTFPQEPFHPYFLSDQIMLVDDGPSWKTQIHGDMASSTTGKHYISSTPLTPQPLHGRSNRPLSTYTSLGSPIHRPLNANNVGSGRNIQTEGRARSLSLGGTATGGSFFHPPHYVPNSPMFFGIGNPQASGTGGLLIPNHPLLHNLDSRLSPRTAVLRSGTTTTAPPRLSDQRKVVEAAYAAERARTKTCEDEELHFTADELRAVLKKERKRAGKVQADFAALRSCTVQQQLQAEVLEEGRINCLMRRMDALQEEKGRIIVELEREEEFVSIENQLPRDVSLKETFART